MSNDKVQKIKELCAPVIQENLERYAQHWQDATDVMETAGILKQLTQDTKSVDDLKAALGNNPEMKAHVESLFSQQGPFMFQYLTNTNGDKLDTVYYNESSTNTFFINQGRIVDPAQIIDCRKLIQKDNLDEVVLEINLEIQAFNKHGFNLDILPEPAYSDDQIAELFKHVDFTSPSYDCQNLADMLVVGGAINASEYCLEA